MSIYALYKKIPMYSSVCDEMELKDELKEVMEMEGIQ
jgi:hypothetical protein